MAGLMKLGLCKSNLVKMKGLIKGKGLIKVYNLLFGYYQYVILGKSNEIQPDGSGGWEYPNNGTGDIPLKVCDTKILTIESGVSVRTNVKLVGQQSFDFEIEILPDNYSANRALFYSGGTSGSAGQPGLFIRIAESTGFVYCYCSDGTSLSFRNGTCDVRTFTEKYKLSFLWDGINGQMNIDYSQNDVSISNEDIGTLTGWVGDSYQVMQFFIVNPFAGKLFYIKLTGYFEYWCQDARGITLRDSLGNENDASLINANLAVTWGTRSDIAKPALLIYGVEIYENNSFPGIQSEYLYIIYSNGTPRNLIVSGFTKIEEHEPNSGFFNTGNTLQNKDDATLNAKFDEFAALAVFKYPNKFTFDQLNDVDLTGIAESDFTLTKGITIINIKAVL